MNINGKNVDFMLTVGAAMQIAALCPDRDLRKIGDIMADTFGALKLTADMAEIMSRAAAAAHRFAGEPETDTVSVEELLALDMTGGVYKEVTDAVFAAFNKGQETAVKTAPVHGKKNG